MVSDFQGYCSSSLENENTFAIEMRKHFTEVATESQVKMSAKESRFQKS